MPRSFAACSTSVDGTEPAARKSWRNPSASARGEACGAVREQVLDIFAPRLRCQTDGSILVPRPDQRRGLHGEVRLHHAEDHPIILIWRHHPDNAGHSVERGRAENLLCRAPRRRRSCRRGRHRRSATLRRSASLISGVSASRVSPSALRSVPAMMVVSGSITTKSIPCSDDLFFKKIEMLADVEETFPPPLIEHGFDERRSAPCPRRGVRGAGLSVSAAESSPSTNSVRMTRGATSAIRPACRPEIQSRRATARSVDLPSPA